MARINRDFLTRQLANFGFRLNLPECLKGGISFVRPSSVAPLFDHIRIAATNPIWAETYVSAATYSCCQPSVSERDERLRILLSGRSPPVHASMIRSQKEARQWQMRLVEVADDHASQTAAEMGPALVSRLANVLTRVNEYIDRAGDIFAILDREFAYLNECEGATRATASQLASNYVCVERCDLEIASMILARHGEEIESSIDPWTGRRAHSDPSLSARLILLSDFVRRSREEYVAAGGLLRKEIANSK